ncbi:MAG: hypothetical protein GF329_01285 [Candidatus Lokiarchaeota archaeon]|nr:hypothetical protein [Candidatus Lokiarchaeota archaeon]
MTLSELISFKVEIVNIFNNYEEIIYDLYQPIDKKLIEVAEAFYSDKSKLVLIKNNEMETIGHVCCFYNERKNQLEFGFFGQKDHKNDQVSTLLIEKIDDLRVKWGAKHIIGPINTPAAIYLYGFDRNDLKQKKYIERLTDNGYKERSRYRIFDMSILFLMASRNLKKPHDFIHIKSTNEYKGNDLKKDLYDISKAVISPISPDLVIPHELIDAILYVVKNFGYPECIQMTRDAETLELTGEAIFVPNIWPKHLVYKGKSDELRVVSGGWKKVKGKGMGYSKYHYTHFANICKKKGIKKLTVGPVNTKNIKAIKSLEKLGLPLEYEYIVLEK